MLQENKLLSISIDNMDAACHNNTSSIQSRSDPRFSTWDNRIFRFLRLFKLFIYFQESYFHIEKLSMSKRGFKL